MTYLRRYFSFLKPYRLLFISLTLMDIIGICGAIASMILSEKWTDAALDKNFELFYKYVTISIILWVIGITIEYFSISLSSSFKAQVKKYIKDSLVTKTQKMHISSVEKLGSGDIISRIDDNATRVSEFITGCISLPMIPVAFFGAAWYMYSLSWKLLLAVGFMIPISAMAYNHLNKPAQKVLEKYMTELGYSNNMLKDAIDGAAIIRTYNLQETFISKYGLILDKLLKLGLRVDLINQFLSAISITIKFLPLAITPLVGGILIYNGEMTYGGFLASNSMVWILFFPAQRLNEFITNMKQTVPAAKRLTEMLDMPEEFYGNSSGADISPKKGVNAIEFNDVSFSYDGNIDAVRDLTFSVRKGEKIVLAGPSGCGKSTVMKLICGYYMPDKGSIKVMGVDAEVSGVSATRDYISYVSQDTYLFPLSVKDNIALAGINTDVMFSQVEAAATAARADDFIISMSEGYETIITERGAKLSGGQKQRLSLARAFIKDNPVLLLDEHTSALDNMMEQDINDTIFNLSDDKTVLVVAHRLSMAKDADRIIVMDGGTVVEEGKHHELMERGGLYAKLYWEN